MPDIIPIERIEDKILLIRGHKVILDRDLAKLYGVETKRLLEQVRRNMKRFPSDFMFQLTTQELINLRSQIATSSWGGTRYLPHVFTEHGALMAANVLNSKRAVDVSVQVIRAFVKLRELAITHRDLSRKLQDLEAKYDKQFDVVFKAIRQLMAPPPVPPKRKIGFHP